MFSLLENDLDNASQHILQLIVLEHLALENEPDGNARLVKKVESLIALVGADTWKALLALRAALGNGPFYDSLQHVLRGECLPLANLPSDLAMNLEFLRK